MENMKTFRFEMHILERPMREKYQQSWLFLKFGRHHYNRIWCGEVVWSNGIPCFRDYCAGGEYLLYPNIDITGSLSGMRKNYGWDGDSVIRAHKCYLNISKPVVEDEISALLLVMEKLKFNPKDHVGSKVTIGGSISNPYVKVHQPKQKETINRKIDGTIHRNIRKS